MNNRNGISLIGRLGRKACCKLHTEKTDSNAWRCNVWNCWTGNPARCTRRDQTASSVCVLSFGYFSLHKQRKVTGCRATPDDLDLELKTQTQNPIQQLTHHEYNYSPHIKSPAKTRQQYRGSSPRH